MGKAIKIVGIGVGFLVIVVLAAYFILGGTSTEPARLIIDSELVQVNFGNGFKDVSGEITLKENDIVKTRNGEATIILYDSIIISLSQDTEVEISDLTKKYPKVKQTSGSTWNKFADIVGIENFDVETPTTVATVRGTEFGVKVVDDTTVLVGEGEVDVLSEGRFITLREFEVTTIAERVLRTADTSFDASAPVAFEVSEPEIREATDAEKREMLEGMTRTLKTLKYIRDDEVFDNTLLVKTVEKIAGTDEEGIRESLREIDEGIIDDNRLIEDAPVKPPILRKIKSLNDNIKEEQETIERTRDLIDETR